MTATAKAADTPAPAPAPAPKKSNREIVLAIPIAGECYRWHRKLGRSYDAERQGFNQMEVGSKNDPEFIAARAAIPRNWTPNLDEALASLRSSDWRSVEPDDYRTEKSRVECEATLKDAIDAAAQIDLASPSDADLEVLIGEALRAMEYGGQVDFSAILRGGREIVLPTLNTEISIEGRAIEPEVVNAKGEVVTPLRNIPVFGGATVGVPNFGAFLIRYFNKDGALKKSLVAEAKSLIGDGPQISMAERAALKAAAAERVLTARRQLEVTCYEDEAAGKKVHRPADTPWHVLLWVEPDPAKPSLQVVADNPRRTLHPDGSKKGIIHPGDPLPDATPEPWED